MKARYYQGDGSVVLDVIKENKDGTLDLGDAEGRLIVGKCPQAPAGQAAKEGTASLITDEKKDAEKESASKPKK